MDHLEEIRQTFFHECAEQLSELESGLLSIQDGNHDPELINSVFRAVHSIKGGAAAFGYDGLVEFVHFFETTLDLLRSGALNPSSDLAAVLLKCADVLSDLIESAKRGTPVDQSQVDAARNALSDLSRLSKDDDTADSSSQSQEEDGFVPVQISLDDIFGDEQDKNTDAMRRYHVVFHPNPTLYARANESIRVIRDLMALGDCRTECDISELPLLADIDAEGAYLTWKITIETTAPRSDIESVFEFVTSDCELSISEDEARVERAPSLERSPETTGSEAVIPKPPEVKEQPTSARNAGFDQTPMSAPQETIRVDLEKIDKLVNLVGELVINQAVLSQRVSEAGLARSSSVMIGLEELEQLTRDIQDSVMGIRAQPVKLVFQRMSRIVREVAALTKKSVRLVVDGEGTEVDKTVIERLTDPLTHMVRNSVDHGIEAPEDRIAAGKPEEGTLRLSATHRSGRIIIEVTDDGAGINRERVRGIAIKKGLILETTNLTDDEIDNLIFLPGFSTNEVASSISGRGVGMDVVKRAIQALGGRIAISSRSGHGSTFSISLPLTLAILDGMVVTVANQTLVVPLTAIIETLQPRNESIHSIGGGAKLVSCRGAFIPLIDIGNILSYRFGEIDPSTQVALLVESQGGTKCALLVDAIQGQRQVVIKSLEANYGKVPGIAAATILGDGRVALIVDVDAVLGLTSGNSRLTDTIPLALAG